MARVRHHAPRFDTVEAFEQWATKQPGRWELHDGAAVAMAPERADHARIKARAWQAIERSLSAAPTHCEVLIAGLMVPGPGLRRFQPDVLVACGDRVDGDDQIVAMPIILVEVLSSSTEYVDTGLKLESYFALPSVQHYLILSATARQVIHHRRWDGPNLLTRIHRDGAIELDPPGISIDVADLYRGTNLDSATRDL